MTTSRVQSFSYLPLSCLFVSLLSPLGGGGVEWGGRGAGTGGTETSIPRSGVSAGHHAHPWREGRRNSQTAGMCLCLFKTLPSLLKMKALETWGMVQAWNLTSVGWPLGAVSITWYTALGYAHQVYVYCCSMIWSKSRRKTTLTKKGNFMKRYSSGH